MCAGSIGVTYLLGDTDLFQEESTDLTYTCDEWKKLAGGDPAGTIGLKPPEVDVIETYSKRCMVRKC